VLNGVTIMEPGLKIEKKVSFYDTNNIFKQENSSKTIVVQMIVIFLREIVLRDNEHG